MKRQEQRLGRRDFVKIMAYGALGAAALRNRGPILAAKSNCFSSAFFAPGEPVHQVARHNLYQKIEAPAKVGLVKGDKRYDIVYKSLKLIEDEIIPSIGDKKIMIKPNVVTPINPLGSLHVDAVRAILDFLAPHYKKQIIIGEAAVIDTMQGYKNYGYLALEKEYNVKLVDLNLTDSFEYRYVIDKDNKPIPIRILSSFLDPNIYLISAAPMKTHNIVLVTLSLKNVLLGSPLNDYQNKKNDKGLMHADPNTTATDICHFNMFHLAQEVFPDLAVVDGFEAMEGKGPAWGTPISARVALAGRDAVSVDTLAAKVMGFDTKKVLYLHSLAQAGMGQEDLEKIQIIGTPLAECLYRFKLDDKTAEIYKI